MTQQITNLHNAINSIFPNGTPSVVEWTELKEIINVLNTIGSFNNSNHLFYPDGGGLDLRGAYTSLEPNSIEINTSFSEILSPHSLTFHSFENDDNYDWAFFRLEVNEIQPTGVYQGTADFSEELTEIAPLNYIDRNYWDYNEYNGEPLPKGSRLIIRRLKGSFVIFGKDSTYNHHTSTYDGRHDKYNDLDFRNYIENVRKNGWDK